MTQQEILDRHAKVVAEGNKMFRDVPPGVIIAVLAEEVGEDPESLLGVVQDCVKKRRGK